MSILRARVAPRLLGAVALLLWSAVAAAGSSQAGGEAHHPVEQVVSFAKHVEKAMAARGAHVAIIARVGRPRSELPEGIRFTHTAIAVYSQISTTDGRRIPGYAIYNLYQDAGQPDRSSLVKDFPVDFFAAVHELEAGIIVPSPELQARLLTVLTSPVYAGLHNPAYSVIANPFDTRFQNCTEHTLDVITAAIYETDDRQQIKANLRAYFEPQPVRVNGARLALGALFVSDIRLADHDGPPMTSTFTTIGRFLQKYGATSDILLVAADGSTSQYRP